jgi:hypothetical protein
LPGPLPPALPAAATPAERAAADSTLHEVSRVAAGAYEGTVAHLVPDFSEQHHRGNEVFLVPRHTPGVRERVQGETAESRLAVGNDSEVGCDAIVVASVLGVAHLH